jgi:hypothetical protein
MQTRGHDVTISLSFLTATSREYTSYVLFIMDKTEKHNCFTHSIQRPDIPDILRFAVILGVHNLYIIQDMRQVAQPLRRIVRHPQYLGTNNDIALLRISQPVSYSVLIRPICLPPTGGKI